MEWISVKDRLPTVDESQQKMFVWQYDEAKLAWFYPYESMGFRGRVDPQSFYDTDSNDYEFQLFGVTHWMLPEPPAPEIPADIQTIARNLDDMRKWEKGAGE